MFLDYGMEIDIVRLYIETNQDTETLPRQDFLADDFQAYKIPLQDAAAWREDATQRMYEARTSNLTITVRSWHGTEDYTDATIEVSRKTWIF